MGTPLKKKVKTHTFGLGKYHIDYSRRGLDGVTDTPDDNKWAEIRHDMVILEGQTFKSFHCALHEGMHAEGIPDKYLHDKEGYAKTYKLARFLWRLFK